MSQRISNEQLRKLASDLANEPRFAGFVGPEVVIACILDLADARAELAELKRFSASQEEAHAARDRGAKV